jgi:hypothetical protein
MNFFNNSNSNSNSNGNSNEAGSERDYTVEVQRYSNDELLAKERSKRRRKTGDVVGTGLSAAAAMYSPAMWAVAGTAVKNYLDNNSKHRIIIKEIHRRGLTPLKGDVSDTVFPALASAGTMAVGRAFGGAAGQEVASQAGNILQTVSSRAFTSGGKKSKKVPTTTADDAYSQNQPASSQYSQPQYSTTQNPAAQGLTGASFHVPLDQTPPPTITLQYHPPTAQYPRGYYAPIQVPTSAPLTPPVSPVTYQRPQFTVQPPVMYQQTPPQSPQYYQPQQYQPQPQPGYQQIPPSLAYIQSPSQPQYYGQGGNRALTGYDSPPPY